MKTLLAFALTVLPFTARAENPSIAWPSRQSTVVCGGTVDGEDLKIRVVLENELLAAESQNERALIYLDFHKAGQVHVAISSGMTDADYERREAILEKLSPEDAALMRSLSATQISDFYIGFAEGYFHLVTTMGTRAISLSCQETAAR